VSSKLLLADDSVTIQKVVNLTFADEGIEVISVGDGNSAMDKFLEISPDLVMADVNMPGLDGYRICELIKQNSQTKNVPVVLLVGSFEPFDEEEAKRVGANDYLTKPFQSIRQLVEKVSDLLKESKADKIAFAKPKEAEVQTFETVESDEVSSTETIDSVSHAVSDGNKFGDAGMDDEMIQTNQVGSLPIDEVQRFESHDSDSHKEVSDFPSEFRNVGQPQYEVSEGAAETQPLSHDEFNEITSRSVEDTDSQVEEVVYEPAEEQTYSEVTAETEEIGEPMETEEEFVPTMIPTEQYFQPEEVVEEEQTPIQEIPQEKGFEIEEASAYKDSSLDDTLESVEISDENQTVVEETTTEPEIKSETETSQPGFIDKLRHIFRDREESAIPSITKTGGASEKTDFFRDTNALGTETTEEATQFESNMPETSPVAVAEPEEEIQQEEVVQFEAEMPPVESEVPEPEMAEFEQPEVQAEPADLHEPEAFQPQVAESEPEPVQQEEISSTEWAEVQTEPSEVYEEISESEQEFTQTETEVEEPEIERVSAETTTDVAVETQQETAVEEEEISVVPQKAAEPETIEKAEETKESVVEEVEKETKPKEKKIIDLDEANLLEITPGVKMSPIKSMISNELREEKSDAGESMIVSEYARQSISLSSEVIDMIADRVAEKIAEKVIRELSSEVVSDLADLVVERMERKQLE
jgi:CheY-like chemotaxis protein